MLREAHPLTITPSTMPSNCLCLRPRHCTSPNDGKVCQAKRSRVTPPVNLQPPVRAVSPEDVRRTASGRLVKQRSDQGLPGPRDQPATMLVLGGSSLCQANKTPTTEQSCCHNVAPRKPQWQDGVQLANRILQPSKRVHPDSKPKRTFLQLLQPSKRNVSLDSRAPAPELVSAPAPCKSILEASTRRVERHRHSLDKDTTASQPAAVQTFSDAYLLALAQSDQHWADAVDIAALFTSDIVLKTQDKQTFYGKTAVLRRLNSGISMLAKMLSNGTRATSMLQPFITGPEKVDTAVWVMTYTFKQGVIEYGIRSQFSFTADKITMIHNSRI
ncbi:TPA: hypothetical protein ACH3X2_008648 [Trebouxia sp. C0005]